MHLLLNSFFNHCNHAKLHLGADQKSYWIVSVQSMSFYEIQHLTTMLLCTVDYINVD